MNTKQRIPTSVRLTSEVAAALDRRVVAGEKSKTEVIEEALRAALGMSAQPTGPTSEDALDRRVRELSKTMPRSVARRFAAQERAG